MFSDGHYVRIEPKKFNDNNNLVSVRSLWFTRASNYESGGREFESSPVRQ